MRARFLARMASLMLVDLGITGIFIAVSGRLDVLGTDILANLSVFGALNIAGAYWLFRPIQAHLKLEGDAAAAAQARISALPWLASGWAVICTLVYCLIAFSLGVFMPNTIDARPVSDSVFLSGLVWFAVVYALYYGFYVYFSINDFTNDLKRRLFADGLIFRPEGTRILHKLIVVFLVTAFVPSLLIALDLSLFRGIRAAQGLSVEQTILLDLMASAFLIAVSLFFVTRSLIRPIDALTAAMRDAGNGRFGNRAPVLSSDELGVLAERFNQMLADLRDREFIRETFGRYVPKQVAATLLDQKGVLEPRLQTATVLFADIEGFTRIAEAHDPGTVLRMLNEYFSAAIEPINRAGGVVNQFQGDAMLVTFNVPVVNPGHADAAVTAAREVQQAIRDRSFAGIRVRARIGIHSGEVIAGAVGSDDRLSYTVHGDAVNLAARLEALNKDLGTQVLVSGTTVAQLRDAHSLEPMGDVGVRGKTAPVDIYKLAV